jgi:hypothetical protein
VKAESTTRNGEEERRGQVHDGGGGSSIQQRQVKARLTRDSRAINWALQSFLPESTTLPENGRERGIEREVSYIETAVSGCQMAENKQGTNKLFSYVYSFSLRRPKVDG